MRQDFILRIRSNFQNILIIKEVFIIFREASAMLPAKACECTTGGEDSGYVCGTGRQKVRPSVQP